MTTATELIIKTDCTDLTRRLDIAQDTITVLRADKVRLVALTESRAAQIDRLVAQVDRLQAELDLAREGVLELTC